MNISDVIINLLLQIFHKCPKKTAKHIEKFYYSFYVYFTNLTVNSYGQIIGKKINLENREEDLHCRF